MTDSNNNPFGEFDFIDPIDPLNPLGKRFSFEDACALDKYLFSLSMYEVVGGKMLSFTGPEDYLKVQVKAVERFNYYKRMIQLGEFTILDISNMIVEKNAALPELDLKVNLNSDESISRMMNIFEDNIIQRENAINKLSMMKKAENQISEYLKNFSSELLNGGNKDGKNSKKDETRKPKNNKEDEEKDTK